MHLYVTSAAFPQEARGNSRYRTLTDLELTLVCSGAPPENMKELEDRFYALLQERRQYDINEVIRFIESGKKSA